MATTRKYPPLSNAADIRIDRLEKILDHLLHGDLSVDHFYFGAWRIENAKDIVVTNENEEVVGTLCGTVGCAVGEFPFLFPDEWSFDWIGSSREMIPRLTGYTGSFLPCGHVAHFLGITYGQAIHLFSPLSQQQAMYYGGHWLDNSSDRYDVAENIRQFILIAKGEPVTVGE